MDDDALIYGIQWTINHHIHGMDNNYWPEPFLRISRFRVRVSAGAPGVAVERPPHSLFIILLLITLKLSVKFKKRLSQIIVKTLDALCQPGQYFAEVY